MKNKKQALPQQNGWLTTIHKEINNQMKGETAFKETYKKSEVLLLRELLEIPLTQVRQENLY